jgi:hypothetical protein
MIRLLHQPPDSASVSVCRSADVGEEVSLLCEQCGPLLLCSNQESLPSVLWVKTERPTQDVDTAHCVQIVCNTS